MRKLDKKIVVLTKIVNDEELLTKTVHALISNSDMNNDHEISRAEFQKILQVDLEIHDFGAIDDLFTSLDKDHSGHINANEFKPFFRAQTKIKLDHLKQLKKMRDQPKQESDSSSGTSSDSDAEHAVAKKNTKFGKWKSTRN